MMIAGLLSSKKEAEEIQFIVYIVKIKHRIRLIIKETEIKELFNKERTAWGKQHGHHQVFSLLIKIV